MVHLFLSPHLDDIALSCAGLAGRLARQGERVIMATFCTADYEGPFALSSAAEHEHRQWQLAEQPYRYRRAEDLQAAHLLGAEALHLGLFDAIYRYDDAGRPLYEGKQFIGGHVHPHDWDHFYPRVVDVTRQTLSIVENDAQVYCPLSIGGHVDHVLVRQAVEQVCDPARVVYYEDYPYAGKDPEALRPYLEQAGLSWRPVLARLTDAEIEVRIAAIACYRSQLLALFGELAGGAPAMPAHVKEYIAHTGGERYWQHTIQTS
ncbi:MAG: PIG-L deacetylase family protein [Candidatus Roseilinea sp.]|uniref:PIG-L deacetylase family protein n=1 Tax=Candidatus Roseilinea sp. TaxID=2838777 RepID=UPI0040498D6E